jgi:hypothetical protein
MKAVLTPECLSPLSSRTLRSVFVQEFFFLFIFSFSMRQINSVYLSTRQDDVRTSHFSTATTTSTWTPTTLGLRGYRYSLVSTPVTIYTSSRYCNCGDVSSSNSIFDLFSGLTVCGAPAVTVGRC